MNPMTIIKPLLAVLLLCFSQSLLAQQPSSSKPDTSRQKEVEVDHADVLEYIQQGDTVLQKLNGNVELRQDSVYMYCDTAIIKNRTRVFANGQVIIQQGDSLNVFADSAVYDGGTRIAELYGEVILEKGEQRLFTDRLTYDLNTKVATYQNNATLTQGETQLTSKKGYYYVDEQQIFFKDSVVVIDTAFTLLSDTLGFNTESRVVDFLGPTLITADSTQLYCEDGYYDTKNNLAEFTKDAQYKKGEQIAVADTIRYEGDRKIYSLRGNATFEEGERKAEADIIIYEQEADKTTLIGNATYRDKKQNIQADRIDYDAKQEIYSTRGRSRISDPPQILEADQVDYSEERGLGVAMGNVVWRDTSAQLTIVCDTADYNRKTDYLKAFGGRGGRPMLITMMDGDSLFMASDTLMSVLASSMDKDSSTMVSDTLMAASPDSVKSDSARLLLAYHDVRIYKSDMQAISDSLSYSTADSTFRLFREPIVWSDTSQFFADTINILLDSGKIDRIFMRNNGFIINSPDEIMYNQVKGKHITAFFFGEELRRMAVNGNAESVYYAIDDDDAYVGVNKTICSEMLLYFGNNEVEKIKFYTQPKAQMLPMGQTDHQALRLEGFRWEKQFRPYRIEDLFAPEKKRDLPPLANAQTLAKRPVKPRDAAEEEEEYKEDQPLPQKKKPE
jgi:lipopolysaccharide export system protein LptA